MTKESATRWLHEVNFISSVVGYSNPDSASENPIKTGSSLEIDFYFVDRSGVETKMQCPPFKVRLPLSLVSQDREAWPVHKFYPYFFETEGNGDNSHVSLHHTN